MDIIKKFGDMVGERSIRDPEKARKLLLTGYRLQEKRLQLFPDRKLPASGQYVARVVMQNIIKALAKPDDTALVSIFVPGELLTAAGITPYSVEAMSCFIAGTRCEQAFLAQTESEGFPETMCSYHRVFLGASMTGLVPKPKCTIYTNLACDGNMMTFPYLKQKYQIPGFYIDVPYEKNQDSISYVADQLRELKKFLEDVGGKKISEQSVQRAVANSNEAASYYSSQLALRKDHDPVTSLTNELYAIFMCHLLAGSEESLKYTKMLLEDVKKAPKGEGLHILWMHMMPFLQEPVKDVFNYSQNVHIRACDFVADGFQRMQASDPYEALAEKMVNCIYNGSVKQRIRRAQELANLTEADGGILFAHWGCMIHYVCKYTPLELFKGFGEECAVLEEMPENFELSDQIAHANLCGFGKSVIQAVLEGKVEQLVLVNCCDSMRRVYDIVESTGKCKFLYMLDMPHEDNDCEKVKLAQGIHRLKKAYEKFSGKTFDRSGFLNAFSHEPVDNQPYIGVLGVRVSGILEKMIRDNIRMDVENLTCTGGRRLAVIREELEKMEDDAMFLAYADALLSQMPCFRMNNSTRRNRLYLDPNLKGIIYHTIKFCDYYGFEYASIKRDIKVPLLKIETDFTSQSAGQLLTRVQAFAETLEGSEDMDPSKGISEEIRKKMESGVYYVAGIDSGSTSTDVVILDKDGKIKSTMIIPTGGGAMMSAEKSLEMAVEKAGIRKEDIVRIVTTGYGRAYIDSGDDSITEITCHAKGAHYLNPNVRTVIDIGGQDIKAISIDENGAVKNFLMNDKCAAGTGRFLEMMARTLGLSLEEMSTRGLEWKENVVISSMCTVFAESEVVSLVAQNKDVADIIHGLNVSVASKVGALAARLGKKNPGEYMMTGGVARNKGIIQALEEKLGAKLYICDEAQLCGALGAALFAYEKCNAAR